ncbi:MAG: hypothetical protein C0624_09085 [Desulfuromonas sp.]|nr:MAG: hypothetical protein C0624_09085 [Desulfuromonas sp.]
MADKSILLVDDLEFFLDTEKEFLKQTNATIYTTDNGANAIDYAVQYQPDLIYMDVHMPEMDGITCCKYLKGNPTLSLIPTVLIYDPNKGLSEQEVLASGCDKALAKPFTRNEFLELGHNLMYDVERRAPRIPCDTTVEFGHNGTRQQALSLDLSFGGMYLQYREPIEKDLELTVSFMLPTVSPRKLELSARSAWVNQGFPRSNLGLPQGFGIQFENLSGLDKEVIADYLDRYAE